MQCPDAVPFMRCFCSICRKLAGSGGFGCNLGARTTGMILTGGAKMRYYSPSEKRGILRAVDSNTGVMDSSDADFAACSENEKGDKDNTIPSHRAFCGDCGSSLWNYDNNWPTYIHPAAGAVDTPLPVVADGKHTDIFTGGDSAANWASAGLVKPEKQFEKYPDESLKAKHERMKWERSG
jgi:hypothetical protein